MKDPSANTPLADHPQQPVAQTHKTHHPLESLLGRNAVRKLLRCLMGEDGRTPCFFERFAENYNNPALRGWSRWKWRPVEFAVDLALKRAKLDKRVMTEKLFHHQPTVRALALTGRSIARYGLTAPQRFVAPLMVVWNFTQACNLRCKHCYQNATPKPSPDELSLEEKLRVVDEMGAAGVPFLAIAGGEPLTSAHLWPVLERARLRKIHISLATNGVLLTPETVARLVKFGVKYVEVSIDSLDAAEHDRFRGRQGAWARSIQGIRNCVQAGMRTGLATCFTRHTVETVDQVIAFAVELGCSTFSHFNFIPVGRGKDMIDADLTPAQREWLLQRLVHHLQQGKINILSTAPQFVRACVMYAPREGIFATGHAGTGKGSKTMVLSRYTGGCGAGRCYCAIEPNGDVTPCVYMPSLKVGSLREASFESVWNNALFDLLSDRTDRGGHCRVCTYGTYCGGCRARAYAYTGDLRSGDPGCQFNKKLWDQLAEESSSLSLVSAAALNHYAGDGSIGEISNPLAQ